MSVLCSGTLSIAPRGICSFYNFTLLCFPPDDPFYRCKVKVEKCSRCCQFRGVYRARVLEFKNRRHILEAFLWFLEVYSQETGQPAPQEEERCVGLEGRKEGGWQLGSRESTQFLCNLKIRLVNATCVNVLEEAERVLDSLGTGVKVD